MGLPRRRRTYRDEEAWFLINMSSTPVIGVLKLDEFQKVTDLIEGSLKTKLGKLKVQIDAFSIRCLVVER